MTNLQGRTRRVLLEVKVEAALSDTKRTTDSVNWIFPNESLCVGRSVEESQLAISNDSAMSRRHFQIDFDGRDCHLFDLKSANGTLVNGKRVEDEVQLQDGDEICAGSTVFRIAILGDSVEGDTRPSSDEFRRPASAPKARDAAPVATARLEEVTVSVRGGSAPSARIVTLCITADCLDELDAEAVSRSRAWIRSGQSILIGSSAYHADWTVPAELGVAELHFQVSFDGRRSTLQNHTKSHVLRLNGQEVTEAELHDGDIVTAGSISFEVQMS